MAYTYSEQYCIALAAHFGGQVGTNEYDDKTGKAKYRANPLPTFPGFALKIGVPQTILEKWAEEYEDFGHAYAMAVEAQKNFILQNMMSGGYNSASAIYAIKNLMKWEAAADLLPDREVETLSDKEIVRRLMYIEGKGGRNLNAIAPESESDIVDADLVGADNGENT